MAEEKPAPGATLPIPGRATPPTSPAAAPSDPGLPDPLLGAEPLGQYRIERKIGEGGFGAVYLAEQLEVKRKAVIKVLRAGLAGSEESARRFKREASVLAALDHQHLIRFYNFGELDDGQLFIAMEYGGDRTLADEIEQGRFSEERALRITVQVCEALAEAHARGVVHRDLKPSNILLGTRDGRDWVKVVDVGIAKILERSEVDDSRSTLTGAGSLMGTPMYFSPEQARGLELDGRSDVYSMGCVLYEMLSGALPIEAAGVADYVHAHSVQPPIPLRQRGVSASSRVQAILRRSLAKDPAQRMTAAEMGELAERASARRTTGGRAGWLLALGGAAVAVAMVAGRGAGMARPAVAPAPVAQVVPAPPVVAVAVSPPVSPVPPVAPGATVEPLVPKAPPRPRRVAAAPPQAAPEANPPVPATPPPPPAPDPRIARLRELIGARKLKEAIAEGEQMMEQQLPRETRGPLYQSLQRAHYDYGDSVGALHYAVLYREYCPPEGVEALDKQIDKLRADLGLRSRP